MHQIEEPGVTRKDVWSLIALFVPGLILLIWSGNLFARAFIPPAILATSFIGGGILGPFVFHRLHRKVKFTRGAFLATFCLFIVGAMTIGAAMLFSISAPNYYGRSTKTVRVSANVYDRGYETLIRKGKYCQQPYIKVRFRGQTKTMALGCGREFREEQQFVMILSRGLFGYYVIENRDAIWSSGVSSPHIE